jgi:hypothetical protein
MKNTKGMVFIWCSLIMDSLFGKRTSENMIFLLLSPVVLEDASTTLLVDFVIHGVMWWLVNSSYGDPRDADLSDLALQCLFYSIILNFPWKQLTTLDINFSTSCSRRLCWRWNPSRLLPYYCLQKGDDRLRQRSKTRTWISRTPSHDHRSSRCTRGARGQEVPMSNNWGEDSPSSCFGRRGGRRLEHFTSKQVFISNEGPSDSEPADTVLIYERSPANTVFLFYVFFSLSWCNSHEMVTSGVM